MRERKYRVWPLVMSVGLVAVIAVVMVAVLNRAWLADYFEGLGYRPTAEMASVIDKLPLTDRGMFLLNASRPVLNERGDFNRNCRDDESEMAVLGCYRERRIYVYNITDEDLAGIRELTLAHELLHAVYERLSEHEKASLDEVVRQTYAENLATLEGEVENYDADEQVEEMYVRLGTEVKNLPVELERHFAGIFSDQDKVVGYYEGYIAVFRGVEARLGELGTALDIKKAEIDTKQADYERRAAQLDADIVSFNACAAVAGCMQDEVEFSARRAGLLDEREALVVLLEELDKLISEYNALVAEYNENAVYGQLLADAINSSVVPGEVQLDDGGSADNDAATNDNNGGLAGGND